MHPHAVALLHAGKFDVTSIKASLGEDDLIEKLQGVSVLCIRARTRITRRVLENAPDLTALGAYCISTNHIDLDAATLRGVAVFNAPYSNTRNVAELVIAEIICLVRRLHDKILKAHEGIRDKSSTQAREVRGKVVGIVGFGNIGSQVSTLAEGMGMEVYYFDTADKLTIGNARRISSLRELLGIADVLTIHVDGDTANTNLIDGEEFAARKEGTILLNLSRGDHLHKCESPKDHPRRNSLSHNPIVFCTCTGTSRACCRRSTGSSGRTTSMSWRSTYCTNELIGDAIADVDREYKDSLFDDLCNVGHTIRSRVL